MCFWELERAIHVAYILSIPSLAKLEGRLWTPEFLCVVVEKDGQGD